MTITQFLYYTLVLYSMFMIVKCKAIPVQHLVILSLFYYNAILAIVALHADFFSESDLPIFLNSAAMEQTVAEANITVSLIASTVLIMGVKLRQFLFRNKRRTFDYIIPVSISLQKWVGWLLLFAIILIILGIGKYGISNFLSGYKTGAESRDTTGGGALVYFSYELIGFLTFIWISSFLQIGKKNGISGVITSVLILLGITLIRGKRLEFVISLLPVILFYWETRLSNISSRLLFVSCGAVLLSVGATLRLDRIDFNILFNIFSEGIYAGHVMSGVLDAANSGVLHFEHGARFLLAGLAIIPNFLFLGNKDDIYSTFSLQEYGPLGATSFLAEIYLQGGYFSVVLFFLMLGYICDAITISSVFRGNLTIKKVIYIIFVCSFIPHFRDGIAPTIKIPAQILLCFGLLLIFSGSKIIRKMVPHIKAQD